MGDFNRNLLNCNIDHGTTAAIGITCKKIPL